jgi:hypothetical protein
VEASREEDQTRRAGGLMGQARAAILWTVVITDQMPCFFGVPTCD